MRYSKYPGNCRRDDPNRGCLGATSEAVRGSNAQSVHIGLTLTVHRRGLQVTAIGPAIDGESSIFPIP